MEEKERLDALERQVEQQRAALFGNGEKGLDERMRNLERRTDATERVADRADRLMQQMDAIWRVGKWAIPLLIPLVTALSTYLMHLFQRGG